MVRLGGPGGFLKSATVVTMLAAVAACAPPEQEGSAGPGAGEARTSAPDTPAAPAETARSEGLPGTAWRLVEILSMDGAVFTPENPAVYTLALLDDGSAQVQADCNRARGTWTSESPGQLVFGPMASTKAACPPGSLHDRYLAQFEWVRSYVMRDGHLFLATMADGAIIEFEPVEME